MTVTTGAPPPVDAVPRRRFARAPRLQVVERGPLRVADVALFYGERSGGIRTYLDAKAEYVERTHAFEHVLVVPGERSPVVNRSNGYRLPVRDRMIASLETFRPDVVLLHDPFWQPRSVCRAVHGWGGRVVMVHHGSAALDAAAWPGPSRLYTAGLRGWLRRVYAQVDVVMSACETWEDARRFADLPLRFGLHPAFRPQSGVARGDHVLYAGRLSREKGIVTLLEATARSHDAWPLRLVGSGPAESLIHRHARRLGIEQRLQLRPFIDSPQALAREYARARTVVMPGALETFGLTAFEAAACGAPVVACATAPSTAFVGELAETFVPDDPETLRAAIARARTTTPDRSVAEAFADRHTWERAFAAELSDLKRLVAW